LFCFFLFPPGVFGDLGETGTLPSPSASLEDNDARGVGILDVSIKSNEERGVSAAATVDAFGVPSIDATDVLGTFNVLEMNKGEGGALSLFDMFTP
jgi:hypothetical protein